MSTVWTRVLAAMEDFAFFAPAHNPPYIAAMRSFPGAALPARRALRNRILRRAQRSHNHIRRPYEWKLELGVRRYGFHGASHRRPANARMRCSDARHPPHLVSPRREFQHGRDPQRRGSGHQLRDLPAIRPPAQQPHRRSRCFRRAVRHEEAAASGVDEMADDLRHEIRPGRISGTSGDVRDLEAARAAATRAAGSRSTSSSSIRRYMGAFLVELGGLDVLTFSGGIGENSPAIRAASLRESRKISDSRWTTGETTPHGRGDDLRRPLARHNPDRAR